MLIYYFNVCQRKLWYFYHEISMEKDNENVRIGKELDEHSYQRDEKHINIDDVINIDFIRAKGVLHEVKKSNKIEEAGIWQLKYYLYYLKKRGLSDITGQIDYPLLKQTIEVYLSEEDVTKIDNMIDEIKLIVEQKLPPNVDKKRFCKSCAYFDLCYI